MVSDKYKILPITREYALVELAKYPTFEQQARERWIDYYLEFTERYGGKDWENWRIKYDVLEEEWKNILQVVDWCGANGHYQDVVKIWNNIDNYIDLSGDWDTRYKWWQWLREQSSKHKDWSTYITALSTQAWILILKGSEYFPEGEIRLKEAWKTFKAKQDDANQDIYIATISLAIINSIFFKIQEDYDSSLEMLNQAEELLKNVNIENPDYSRYFIRIIYCRAEIYCCSQYQNRNMEQAKDLFSQVCEQGKKIRWTRHINYAENDLANIAIEEQDYQTASEILERGLREAISHRENRRIGHWLTSYWRLALKQNNSVKGEQSAKEALDYFSETAGIIKDAQEIKCWLKQRKNNFQKFSNKNIT